MGGTDPRKRSCPIEVTMGVLCKKWKPRVLRVLALKSQRFGGLQTRIPTVSHKVLIETLRELETDGLVLRHVIPGGAKHVEYHLTGRGQSLLPILDLMDAWGRDQDSI